MSQRMRWSTATLLAILVITACSPAAVTSQPVATPSSVPASSSSAPPASPSSGPPASPSPGPTGGPIAGVWNGTWAGITYPETAGTFTMTFSQSGRQLSGPITITGTPCLTGGTITGSVNGNMIEFGAVEGEVTVLYDGIVAGATMSGSWTTDCGESTGTWQATRAAP